MSPLDTPERAGRRQADVNSFETLKHRFVHDLQNALESGKVQTAQAVLNQAEALIPRFLARRWSVNQDALDSQPRHIRDTKRIQLLAQAVIKSMQP